MWLSYFSVCFSVYLLPFPPASFTWSSLYICLGIYVCVCTHLFVCVFLPHSLCLPMSLAYSYFSSLINFSASRHFNFCAHDQGNFPSLIPERESHRSKPSLLITLYAIILQKWEKGRIPRQKTCLCKTVCCFCGRTICIKEDVDIVDTLSFTVHLHLVFYLEKNICLNQTRG